MMPDEAAEQGFLSCEHQQGMKGGRKFVCRQQLIIVVRIL